MLVQTHPDLPLVVGANRDELLDRPAVPMALLRDEPPRVLGGRDELAGGTWLAVNEAGVVAGLTNRPLAGRRDPNKRSRGELPLALASHETAIEAVEAFAKEFRPSDYNPAWLLIGDRESAFTIDMTEAADGDRPVVEPLTRGVYVLENRALRTESAKVDHVRRLLAGTDQLTGAGLVRRLQSVLADHEVPAGYVPEVRDDGEEIPVQVKAACVHTERYGTRWSAVVTVPRAASEKPALRYADGPPCTTCYRDAGVLWR